MKSVDVRYWQNGIMETTDENGMPYSPVYLKTIHNQHSTMFNYAVLKDKPASFTLLKRCIGADFAWTRCWHYYSTSLLMVVLIFWNVLKTAYIRVFQCIFTIFTCFQKMEGKVTQPLVS